MYVDSFYVILFKEHYLVDFGLFPRVFAFLILTSDFTLHYCRVIPQKNKKDAYSGRELCGELHQGREQDLRGLAGYLQYRGHHTGLPSVPPRGPPAKPPDVGQPAREGERLRHLVLLLQPTTATYPEAAGGRKAKVDCSGIKVECRLGFQFSGSVEYFCLCDSLAYY